jgi:hypothetical protein
VPDILKDDSPFGGGLPPLLTDLAARINAEHDAASRDAKSALEHAFAAGGFLIEASNKIPHGEWLLWLADNCTVSERTAQFYMRLARERPAIEAKTQRVADLTLRGAVKLLAAPLNEQTVGQSEPTGSTKTRKKKAPVTRSLRKLRSAWNSSSEKTRNDFLTFAKSRRPSVEDELKAFAVDELATLLKAAFSVAFLIALAGLIASPQTVDANSSAKAVDDDAPNPRLMPSR